MLPYIIFYIENNKTDNKSISIYSTKKLLLRYLIEK